MPTITHTDALLTATGNLRKVLDRNIPQSQYNKGMVDQCMAILNANANANAKIYQSDSVLQKMV